MGKKSSEKIQRRIAAAVSDERRNHVTSQPTLFAGFRSGPIPDADEMARYGEVVPGLPEALVDAYLRQGDHRRSLEDRVIRHDIIKSYIGMGMAFTLAAGISTGSFMVILRGGELIGIAGIVIAISSLVGVFIVNKRQQGKELEKRRDS